jgi:hypothetical protein
MPSDIIDFFNSENISKLLNLVITFIIYSIRVIFQIINFYVREIIKDSINEDKKITKPRNKPIVESKPVIEIQPETKPNTELQPESKSIIENIVQRKKNEIEQVKEIKPIESKKEIKPIESKKEIKPIKPIESKKEIKPIKPIESKKEIKPIESKKEIKPIESNKEIKPIKQNKEIKPIKQNKEIKSMKPNKEIKPRPELNKFDSFIINPYDIHHAYENINDELLVDEYDIPSDNKQLPEEFVFDECYTCTDCSIDADSKKLCAHVRNNQKKSLDKSKESNNSKNINKINQALDRLIDVNNKSNKNKIQPKPVQNNQKQKSNKTQHNKKNFNSDDMVNTEINKITSQITRIVQEEKAEANRGVKAKNNYAPNVSKNNFIETEDFADEPILANNRRHFNNIEELEDEYVDKLSSMMKNMNKSSGKINQKIQKLR